MPVSRRRDNQLCLVLLIGAALLLAAGCGREQAPPAAPALATLTGRAVLPADTFDIVTADSRPVGAALEGVINGRRPPFESVPVQGFSSLLLGPDGSALALQDNGFGTLANSADFPLRWYDLVLHLDNPPAAGGAVDVRGFVELSDPDGLLPFPLSRTDGSRRLTGADLDPESFVRLDDGTFWIGEEFGPSLVHVNARGEVLEKPVDVPVVPALRDFARGSPFYRTPDHPDLRFLRHEETRDELANQPRSGGIEGLAVSPAGGRLYAAVEKGLRDDPVAERRVILEFDPARRSFTGNRWLYLADGPDVSLASLEAVSNQVLLVIERDGYEGAEARVKRIYRVELGRVDMGGFLIKQLVCDLLNVDDSAGLTRGERGAVGLGHRYSFPYVTPECLAVVDDSTLIVVNDNNYPMSAGRRPPKTPDDSEFIRLRLHRPLTAPPVQ